MSRQLIDDKSLLSVVMHDVQAAKANKKFHANLRRIKRDVSGGHSDPMKGVTPKPVAKAGVKGAAVSAAPAGPQRKAGGSIVITLKPSFNGLTRAPVSAKARRDAKRGVFVLPPTNKRYRMRCAKAEAAAASGAAESDDAGAPAEEEEDEEAVAVADEDAAPEEQASALQTLARSFPGGESDATRCIIRCRTSLGAVRRPGNPSDKPKKGAGKAAPAKAAAKKAAKRKQKKARKARNSKATCVVTSQKQASAFATNFMALVKKEFQTLLRKDTPAVLAATAAILAPQPAAPPASPPKPEAKKADASPVKATEAKKTDASAKKPGEAKNDAAKKEQKKPDAKKSASVSAGSGGGGAGGGGKKKK